MLKKISIASVIRMLKHKTVTARERRIKYVCLSMLWYVILPTTHTPRISVEPAQRIKDLDEFFSYPWERVF
ncbi:hypothetical protein Bca4012_065622 [Brassica carinata]